MEHAAQMGRAADVSWEASQDLFIILMEAELAGQQETHFILMMPITGKTDEKTEIQPDRNHPFSVVAEKCSITCSMNMLTAVFAGW